MGRIECGLDADHADHGLSVAGALPLTHLQVGIVVLLLFQGRGVVDLMGMDNQGVVGFSGTKYNLLKETRRSFPPVDAVLVPLLAA